MRTSEITLETRRPGTGRGALVDAGWLVEHLHDPNLRVVEVDVSPVAYDDWHIDGAVLWNVYRDLKDSDYRLVDAASLARLVARSGISAESTVVFYGYAPALGVWLMELYGHLEVRILDCSRDAWRAYGGPWTAAATAPADSGYPLPAEDGRVRADDRAVLRAIDNPRQTLVDVRSVAEYRGERFWPSGGSEPDGRTGHIPSAVHQPLEGLYDKWGAYRPAEDLRGVFTAIDLDGDDELITYCTVGARAATAWFVLTHLIGRPNVRVYDGSWAEWGRMADTPVEGP